MQLCHETKTGKSTSRALCLCCVIANGALKQSAPDQQVPKSASSRAPRGRLGANFACGGGFLTVTDAGGGGCGVPTCTCTWHLWTGRRSDVYLHVALVDGPVGPLLCRCSLQLHGTPCLACDRHHEAFVAATQLDPGLRVPDFCSCACFTWTSLLALPRGSDSHAAAQGRRA